jgi:DME family drug/metabolite transporter
VGNVLACLAALPWAWPVTGARPTDWLVLAFLGVVQIGIAYAFLTAGLGRVSALDASLLLLLEPTLNPLWTWLVHGENPGAWSIAGGALVLVATAAKTAVDARRPGV